VEVDGKTTQTLDQYVQDADARMYEIKKRKKASK